MSDSDERLVRSFRIVRVLPCLANPRKIRFTAELEGEISGVFPYMNSVLDGAIYNHHGKTLTLRKDGRLITLHPTRVVAAKIEDLEDAHDVITWIVNLINECHAKRATLNPNYERRNRLTVIDIVRLLPGTNCKKCGQLTCLAFAALLSEEKISLEACADIYLTQFRGQREGLTALLQAGGYAVLEDLN